MWLSNYIYRKQRVCLIRFRWPWSCAIALVSCSGEPQPTVLLLLPCELDKLMMGVCRDRSIGVQCRKFRITYVCTHLMGWPGGWGIKDLNPGLRVTPHEKYVPGLDRSVLFSKTKSLASCYTTSPDPFMVVLSV